MQRIKVYVPMDSAAVAVGADDLVAPIQKMALEQNTEIEIIRNGSRGLLWLEPLIEIETPQGRIGYGPVTLEDLPDLFNAGWLSGQAHPLSHGITDDIPYLKNQERLTFKRVGIIDPLNIHDYAKHGGWQGLLKALTLNDEAIINIVTQSGLRGRGGAAFPTGIKWNTVRQAEGPQKYIVANADEGDSGTFSDRILMEGDPFALIEGMIIAGLAVNASKGYIYVRSEYPIAIDTLQKAITIATEHRYLGSSILGSGHSFELEVRKGAGAYICGEETSLLESLEGKRGVIRYKPPLPAIKGFMGMPTVVNNVVSLATVPVILAQGADFYKNFGSGKSHGTLAFQLAGNLKCGGLVEKAFGISLKELLYDYGGGSEDGLPLKAVQVGGPLGAYLSKQEWDIPLDYEAYAKIGAMVGHGGIVAFSESADMAEMAEYAMAFCATESCGKCTPCRIGSKRGVETVVKIRHGIQAEENLVLLEELCDTMIAGSLCALGGMAPYPVLSAISKYPQDFIKQKVQS
ncbi:formate dehydrogenase beta subunit [Advenella sp. RU8]|uniref:formate dehydrogenase beta subunit n=1 Tax=Advenella sp. RU8 TaxID=3399575 RepID=UPI003AAF4499